NHEGNAANRAVDQQRQIKLARNVGAVLDVEAVDLLAGCAGLRGHQRIAEHFLGMRLGFIDRERKTDTALGIWAEFLELALAAATGVDLALDHIKRARERLGGSFGLVSAEDRDAFGDWRAIALQELLGLIFVNVHAWLPYWPRFGAMAMQASQRPCTDSTDLSNIFCSALFSSISMTRSTPPAPITTGTPT